MLSWKTRSGLTPPTGLRWSHQAASQHEMQPPAASASCLGALWRSGSHMLQQLHRVALGTNPVAAGNQGAVASGSGSPLHVSGRGCGLPGLGWRQCSPVLRGGCAHRGGLCIPPGPGRLGSLQPVHPCPHDRGRCLSAAPENFGWANGPGSMEPAAWPGLSHTKGFAAVRSSAGWSHLPCCHPSGPQAYGASRVHCWIAAPTWCSRRCCRRMVPSVWWGAWFLVSACWCLHRREWENPAAPCPPWLGLRLGRPSCPEKERPGLLLPQQPEDTGVGRRRPQAYCVWLGRDWLSAAGKLRGSRQTRWCCSDSLFGREDVPPASLCQQQGLSFIPLVAETTGAWAPAAAQVLKGIVRAAAAREQGDPAAFFAEFLQEASVLVRRFRGRAALQRRADAALAEASSSAATAAALVLASWLLATLCWAEWGLCLYRGWSWFPCTCFSWLFSTPSLRR